jgi:outer membrane biosynthesis protein TonB
MPDDPIWETGDVSAALDRTRRATVALVALLLALAFTLFALQDVPLGSSPAPAPGDSQGSGPRADAAPAGEGDAGLSADAPERPGEYVVDDDLALTSGSVDLATGTSSPTGPPTPTTGPPTPTTSTPTTPTAPTNPTTPSGPVTPTTPPVTPPVTPTPPAPPTPPASPAAPPTSVVSVTVLSGGSLVGVTVDLSGTTLLSLDLLQP